jgi:serine/threonine-protein kinase RsbW
VGGDSELHRRYPATTESVPQARHAVVAFLASLGADSAVRDNAALAVTEAVSNCVIHAYREGAEGDFELRATREDDDAIVLVRDFGCGPLPDPEHGGLGMGLALMATLTKHFSLGHATPGTEVCLRFAVAGGVQPERPAGRGERAPAG